MKFINGTKSENELADEISQVKPDIDQLYFAEGKLELPPKDLKEWSECCAGLSATIHEFTFIYGTKFMAKRTPENRKACMDIAIKQYYRDLDYFSKLEIQLLDSQ